MRLLFIQLGQVGDVLLLTPTLAAARQAHPSAALWVLASEHAAGLLAGCRAVDRVVAVGRSATGPGIGWGWLREARKVAELRRQRFEYAFELSGNAPGRWWCLLSGARRRCANAWDRQGELPPRWRHVFNRVSNSDWGHYHRVEQLYFTVNECLALGGRPRALEFAPERHAVWPGAAALGTFAVLHPSSPLPSHRWSAKGWQAVGHYLLTLLDNVVIAGGPEDDDLREAKALAAALGPRAVSVAGAISWAQMAGLLGRAHLVVGVESGTLHLAAACRCPCVAVFGASVETVSHPWMVPHRVVVSRRAHVPPGHPAYPASVAGREASDIAADDVIEACREMLAGGRELPG